jgi:hypothetical protein
LGCENPLNLQGLSLQLQRCGFFLQVAPSPSSKKKRRTPMVYLLSLSKKMGKQRGEELEEIVIFPTLYGYYPSL